MIDTDKYEGHTPAPWYAEEEEVEDGKAWTVRGGEHWVVMESDGCLRIDWKKEDALLTADAPLLLEEVKRLRVRYSHHHQYVTNFYAWMVENHIGLVEKWEDEEE